MKTLELFSGTGVLSAAFRESDCSQLEMYSFGGKARESLHKVTDPCFIAFDRSSPCNLLDLEPDFTINLAVF